MRLAYAAAPLLILSSIAQAADPEIWKFDRLDRIGGHPVTVLGHPRVIETPRGKALQFNGVDDAILLPVHPLAGAATFTWEAIFRPDGGQEEQRWFHLQEQDSENRMLFEIRVVDGKWCLDAFTRSGDQEKPLLRRDKLHPLQQWYHVAAVYDGREYRSYVNGVLQDSAVIHFAPQKAGRTSVGMRINQVYYFKGAVLLGRFTRRALSPSDFLKLR